MCNAYVSISRGTMAISAFPEVEYKTDPWVLVPFVPGVIVQEYARVHWIHHRGDILPYTTLLTGLEADCHG